MSKKRVSREEVLEAIRSIARTKGTPWDRRKSGLSVRTFKEKSGLREADIYRNFSSWSDALEAAGGGDAARRAFVGPDELLQDWGRVARKLSRPPPFAQYNFHGKYCGGTLQVRFGSWNNVRIAFQEFAKGKGEWGDVVKFCETAPRIGRGHAQPKVQLSRADAKPKRWKDRPVFGEPVGPLPLRNAPTNESGVVLAFGMLAAQLGFHIETVCAAFPDCRALRKVGPGEWQSVTIEFEFKSANFYTHGHAPDGCDMIVCWEHNWAECPPNLEVIALRDVIEQRSGQSFP